MSSRHSGIQVHAHSNRSSQNNNSNISSSSSSSVHKAMATLNLHALAAKNKGGTLILQSNGDTLPMILPWGTLCSTSKQAPSVDITEEEVLIGRKAKECNVVINNPAISGLHCRVYRKEAKEPWAIQLGSSPDIPKPPEPIKISSNNNTNNNKQLYDNNEKQSESTGLIANFANRVKSLFIEDNNQNNNINNNNSEEFIEESETPVVWKGTKNATLKLNRAESKVGPKRYEIWLEDLSTNGTFLGNNKLGHGNKVQIHSGTEFTLLPGKDRISYVLMVHGESPRADKLEPAPMDQVTLVFTDIESSTNLWENASVAMNLALEQHDLTIRTLLAKFRGYEVKTEGDAFFVAFFTVLDAIKWALAVQEALLRLAWPDEILALQAGSKVYSPSGTMIFNGLRVRMGIHTGYPNCRRNPTTNRMDYFGRPVNTAARVSDTGHGGQIVCTKEVYELATKEIAKQKNNSAPANININNIRGSTPQENLPTPVNNSSDSTPHHRTSASLNQPNDNIQILPSYSEVDELVDVNSIKFLDCGEVNLKGLGQPINIFQVSSPAIELRSWNPSLREKSKAVAEGNNKSSNNISTQQQGLGGNIVTLISPNQSPVALTVTDRGSKPATEPKVRRGSIAKGS